MTGENITHQNSKKSYQTTTERISFDLDTCKTILIDCDGVLTNGNLTIDHNGEKLFKQFHVRDVRAIRELVANGYEVVIISADDWPGIFHYAEKVGAVVHIAKDKSDIPFENFIAIGDDAWDVKMLRNATMAFCPNDADRSVLRVNGIYRLEKDGGKGVISEMIGYIL